APIAGALQVRTQLRLRRAEAEALADLAQQGVRERDIGKLLTLLAEYTTCLLTADYSIATVVDEGNRIALRGTYGVRWARWMSRRYPRRGGATAAALAAGKTLVLEDYDPQAFG